MSWVAEFFAKLLRIIVPLFVAKQWGAARAEQQQAEQIVEEKTEDAKIGSQPYVDNPFGRMRGKKK